MIRRNFFKTLGALAVSAYVAPSIAPKIPNKIERYAKIKVAGSHPCVIHALMAENCITSVGGPAYVDKFGKITDIETKNKDGHSTQIGWFLYV